MINKERYMKFEHALRYLLMDLDGGISKEDLFLLEDIKQCIIVFSMKDRFAETNKIFLYNMKNDFYNGIKRLEENHADIKNSTTIIVSFMEDFYFNN